MPNSKQIVYLSQSQYAELIANGTITVNGVTVTYDENDIYVTPQAEPVTDVRINGTSIAANGVADISTGSTTQFGVMRAGGPTFGVTANSGIIAISGAGSSQVKAGGGAYLPIVTLHQHEATFYGLAKAAGHDEKDSTESVGTYTPEAKGAIQQMLGVSNLIATAENDLVASKAYAVGDVFTANGKLYKVTSAIAADEAIVLQNEGETVSSANAVETKVGEGFVKFTDYATNINAGVVKTNVAYGTQMVGKDVIATFPCTDAYIKLGTHTYNPIVSAKQHQSVFYGLAKAAGADEKDSTLPVGQYTDTAKAAIKSMIGVNVEDVQVNGTSVVSDGVANIPVASNTDYGVVKVQSYNGLEQNFAGYLQTAEASSAEIKSGTAHFKPIVPVTQDKSVFYGLAKASGDTTQSASSNAVGQYTDNAKASIKSMLGIQDGSTGTVDVSGTTPTITAVENTRYVCGEVTSLSFTPSASGISIVRFTSGSTVTVLTLPSTVKFPEWFDPTSLETNTIYEICVTDGVYGAVMSWAL